MLRLKEAGVDSFTMQMEVWDPRLFEEVCPGKAKSRGRDGYIEAFHAAVDVFGAGSVGCNFVGGVTLVAAGGHKTWQEARDSHAEGDRWMTKNGVWSIYTPLRLQPGSIYGDVPANQNKYPPTEFYLEVNLANHQAMKEYGFYQKLNKFTWCAMDCMDVNYSGEIGMLELAGNIGNWLSDAVPDEANWLAKFISSMNK